MFDYAPSELHKIDDSIAHKFVPSANFSMAEIEQLALDSTRMMSCTENRLEDYKSQGFFKRVWCKLCGKQSEMQHVNQSDLLDMQKYAWRYIATLQERDVLLAHSLITIKNNLMTLAVTESETKNLINSMAAKIYERFIDLEDRVKDLEVATKIHSWLLTLDTYDYDEKYSPNFRLLKIVKDFLSLKDGYWNIGEIKYLHKALKEVDLPWKKQIKLADFINGLVEEIAVAKFSEYQKVLYLEISSQTGTISESFVLENIPVPSYTSLYQIADNYSKSSATIDILIDELSIDKKEAIKRVITTFIKKQGIDLEISLPLKDLAVELLSCMKLSKELYIAQDTNGRKVETNMKGGEDEYIKYLEIALNDKVITSDEEVLLSKVQEQYGINNARAAELKAQIVPQTTTTQRSPNDELLVAPILRLVELANTGSIEALSILVKRYRSGEGVPEDNNKAFQYSKLAFEKGDED